MPISNPLDDPLAVLLASLALVLLARLTPLGLVGALPLAVLVAVALAFIRDRHRRRGQRLRDQRVAAELDAAELRSRELAAQAERVRREAMARLTDTAYLEPLGFVQLCCDRLQALPDRIAARRQLLQSSGEQLLPRQGLERRLAREEAELQRETSPALRLERLKLVKQLRINLEMAHSGLDERQARLLALSTRLEGIDGGLRHLQRQVNRHWPSSAATDVAVTQAIAPLDEAIDQIERLLDAGQS
ncbi:MAG: hypothetical protein ACKO2F_04425 [Cyanobacteriota bacterium]